MIEKLVIRREDYVDEITLMAGPRRAGLRIEVERVYRKAAESMDLETKAPWVRWRQTMQGPE